MAIGPVQLIVLGLNHPNFHGEVIAELERLHENGMVRVIDALAVYKDADGDLEVEHLSNLTEAEAIEVGTKIGALIGLGIEGEEGTEAGAAAGAEQAGEEGINVFGGEEWDVIEDIPNDSAAALILLEHHWAVPLRDAIARANGFRISDGFISPLDLVGIGLMTAEEAQDLHAMETSARQGMTAETSAAQTATQIWRNEMFGGRRVARRTGRRTARRVRAGRRPHVPACGPHPGHRLMRPALGAAGSGRRYHFRPAIPMEVNHVGLGLGPAGHHLSGAAVHAGRHDLPQGPLGARHHRLHLPDPVDHRGDPAEQARRPLS